MSNQEPTTNKTSPSLWARTKAFLSYYRLPILSGFLIGTSYIPFPPWALLFCLSPLFVFWQRETSWKRVFIGGWITQFILNLIGFHWISYTAVEFGHFPWIFGLLVLFGFAATAHLHYAISGLLCRIFKDKFRLGSGADLLLLVCVFGLCDRFMPMIFPWHLGYPWIWIGLPGAQFSDVIGFDGLYYFTILVNALIAWAWLAGWSPRSRERKPWALITSALAIFLLLNLAGLGRKNSWRQTDSTAKILAVQGNIGNFEKLQAELQRNFGTPVVQKYLELSRKGLSEKPETQLILWPETAFPDVLDSHYSSLTLHSLTRGFVQEVKTPLLTGGYSRDLRQNAVYNALFYMNAAGFQPEPTYRKSILLVFGETFPFAEYLPYMEKLFPNQGSFGRGAGPQVMNVELSSMGSPSGSLRVGPQICYEGLYSWHSAELAKKGAQVFVNVTNDSWFGWPFEPNQHLYMTLARAIEFRRPLMRSTNTGITTAITAAGDVLEKSPVGVEWTGLYEIPYMSNPPHTLYEKFGFAWTWVLALSVVLLLVFGRNRRVDGTNGSTRRT